MCSKLLLLYNRIIGSTSRPFFQLQRSLASRYYTWIFLLNSKMWLQIVIFVLFLYILWHYLTKPPSNHPTMPPIRFPIIGHFPYLIGYKHLQEAAFDLMEKYGQNGMLSIFLGPRIKGGIEHYYFSFRKQNKDIYFLILRRTFTLYVLIFSLNKQFF